MYLKEIEKIVDNNIKNKTQDHIWQFGEDLMPYLYGLTYSKGLSKEETDKLAERYRNAFN